MTIYRSRKTTVARRTRKYKHRVKSRVKSRTKSRVKSRTKSRSATKKRPRRSTELQIRKRKGNSSSRSAKRRKIYELSKFDSSTYSSPSVPVLPLFQKRITAAFFTTPNKYPKDCCPCVFRLLGLIGKDEVNVLIDEFGKSGMDAGEITGKFNATWPGRSFRFINNDGKGMSKHQFINSVFKSLKPSHATLIGWQDSGGLRHCISFAKNKDGVAQFFDAQTMDWANGLPAVHDVFRDKREVYSLTVDKGGMVV